MIFTLIAATALAVPTAEPVPLAAPRYFFILYGGQSLPFKPRTAHTWATFVKAAPAADGTMVMETVTISWLPETGNVKPYRLRPERGRNFSLDETFAIAVGQGDRVSMWGPFEIHAERYEQAVAQARRLESGVVRYRAIDSFTRRQSVSHCVHAVTYADPVMSRLIQPVLQVGEPGTSRLAKRYDRNGAFLGAPATHDWVIPAIGLDRFPMVRRELGEHIRREFR